MGPPGGEGQVRQLQTNVPALVLVVLLVFVGLSNDIGRLGGEGFNGR